MSDATELPEIAQLRAVLAYGYANTDTRTLRHVQEAKNRVCDAVLFWMAHDDDSGHALAEVVEAGRHLRRLTCATQAVTP